MNPTVTTDESKLNETEFLDAQAADARAAIHETWNELKGTLRETATLEVWARRHPWIVAGTAVAGGFLIATTLLHTKSEQPNGEAETPQQPATPQGGSHWLIETLFSLLKPVLGQLVTALVAGTMGAVGGAVSGAAGDQQPDGRSQDWTENDAAVSGEGPVPT